MPYPNEHACRLVDPKEFDEFRRENEKITVNGKPVDVIFGIKDGKSKIQALRYKKSVWSVEEARNDCKNRGGILFEPAMNNVKNSIEELKKCKIFLY